MHQMLIGNQRIGLVNVLHEADNTMDVRLAHTRDGHSWKWIDRHPWLETGPAGSHEQTMVTAPTAPIVKDDEIYFFYGSSKNHHDWWLTGVAEDLDCPEAKDKKEVGYYLNLAKLRLDGFVSIDTSPVRDGYLTTRPLFHRGECLYLNAQIRKGGFIKVQITDAANHIIEGHGFENCIPVEGDSVRHLVKWNKGSDVPGKALYKVHFHMRKASLYSFQFTTPDGATTSIDPQINRAMRWRKWE